MRISFTISPIMRAVSAALAAIGLSTAISFAMPGAGGHSVAAGASSPWFVDLASRLRLVDAGRGPDGVRLAAIEIEMTDGFRTYWRHPGDSGIPPVIDWSKSDNLMAVDVMFPAPKRFRDSSGFYLGYQDRLTLPVRVAARDPRLPVKLVLAIDYAVCKDICVPVHADATLALPVEAPKPVAHLAAVLREVPSLMPLGGDGGLAVKAVRWNGLRSLHVEIGTRGGPVPDLFVEGGADWLFGRPTLANASNASPNTLVYAVPVAARPKTSAPLRLVLTLAGPDGAVETRVALDGGPVTP